MTDNIHAYIEESGISVDVEVDADDDFDPAFVDTLCVLDVVCRILQGIQSWQEDDDLNPALLFGQDYVDKLQAAFYAGQRLLEHEDFDEARYDMSVLDAETLQELRGSLVYIGQHLGIDVELPAPDGGE